MRNISDIDSIWISGQCPLLYMPRSGMALYFVFDVLAQDRIA